MAVRKNRGSDHSHDPTKIAGKLRCATSATLKALTSLNKESRPFFLSDNQEWKN